jgi:hypothetical protein
MNETDSLEQLTTAIRVSGSGSAPDEDDGSLLALESEFKVLAAELITVQRAQSNLGIFPDKWPQSDKQTSVGLDESRIKEVESILARLDPIERAIMATPARTIVGLGVKARHAAYVTSQYWDGPIEKIGWEAQAVRLLIEAVCNVARAPLLLNEADQPDLGSA